MHAFDTSRLHLRPLADRDGALYCSLYTDPEVMRHIAVPMTLEAAQRSFRAACRLQSPDPQRWIISERDAGGGIGLMGLFADGDTAEIGVMLLPGKQGQGFSAEAIAGMANRVFGTMASDRSGLQRLWARHAPANRPMSKVMQWAGFQRQDGPGTTPAQVRWQLTRDRWQAHRERHDVVAMSRTDQ